MWERAGNPRKGDPMCTPCAACSSSIALAGHVCPPPPDPRLDGLPAGIDTALWLKLDSINGALLEPMGGVLGAYVVRTRDSQLVWAHHADMRTLPASTMKILTVAAALEDLGPEFRWKTQVWATGHIVRGVLKGNLVLEGGGDPTLGVDGAGMGPFVNAVARAGIKRIEGNIVALDTLVGRDERVWPQGWSIGNSRDGYGAPVAGLNWVHNRTKYRSFPEPRKLALLAFSKSLQARKIAIVGTDTTVVVRGDSAMSRRKWTLLGKVSSPKLSEVMRITLLHSVNQYAEAAVLALGTARPNPRYAPRDQGLRRYRQILTLLGVPSSVTADDGSGLSRYDLVTARAMADLLRRDLGRADGLRMTDLLARGGQGTIRYRFGRLPDRSWVSAKTGTLDGTSCLVGLLRVPGRDTLAFALLASGYQGPARKVRAFQDRIIHALAGIPDPVAVDTLAPADSTDEPDEKPTPDASATPTTPGDSAPQPVMALDDTTSVPSADIDTLRPTAPMQTDSVTTPSNGSVPDQPGVGDPPQAGADTSRPSTRPEPAQVDTARAALDTTAAPSPAADILPPEPATDSFGSPPAQPDSVPGAAAVPDLPSAPADPSPSGMDATNASEQTTPVPEPDPVPAHEPPTAPDTTSTPPTPPDALPAPSTTDSVGSASTLPESAPDSPRAAEPAPFDTAAPDSTGSEANTPSPDIPTSDSAPGYPPPPEPANVPSDSSASPPAAEVPSTSP